MRRPISRIGDAFKRHKLICYTDAWKEVAGPALLKVSEFKGCLMLDGSLTLCLQIRDPVWRQEIFHQRKDLLSRYRRQLLLRGLEEEALPTNIQLRAQAEAQTYR